MEEAPTVTRREQLGTDDHQLEPDTGRGRGQNRGRGRGRGRGKRNGKQVDEEDGEAAETNEKGQEIKAPKSRKNEKKQQKEKTEKEEGNQKTGEIAKQDKGKTTPRRRVPKANAKSKSAKPKGKAPVAKRPAQKSAARPSKSAKIVEQPDKSKDKPDEQAPPPAPKGFQNMGWPLDPRGWVVSSLEEDAGHQECLWEVHRRQSEAAVVFAAALLQVLCCGLSSARRWQRRSLAGSVGRRGWASSVIISERHCSQLVFLVLVGQGWAGFFEEKKDPLQYTFPCKKKGWGQECWRKFRSQITQAWLISFPTKAKWGKQLKDAATGATEWKAHSWEAWLYHDNACALHMGWLALPC